MSLDTRLESFIQSKPINGRRRQRIHTLLKRSGIGLTCHELAEILTVEEKHEIQDHSVSGRLTELRQSGHVYEAGTAKNVSTNRTVTVWKAN